MENSELKNKLEAFARSLELSPSEIRQDFLELQDYVLKENSKLSNMLRDYIIDDIANADADYVGEKMCEIGVTQEVLDKLGIDYSVDAEDPSL